MPPEGGRADGGETSRPATPHRPVRQRRTDPEETIHAFSERDLISNGRPPGARPDAGPIRAVDGRPDAPARAGGRAAQGRGRGDEGPGAERGPRRGDRAEAGRAGTGDRDPEARRGRGNRGPLAKRDGPGGLIS